MRYEYIFPAPLGNVGANSGAPRAVDAKRNSALTGNNVYEEGDLVIVDSNGYTTKLVETTPANIANILMAGHSWALKYATVDPEDDSIPLASDLKNNLIIPSWQFIATYQGNAADGADFTVTDVNIFKRGIKYEMKFNATEKCMTIRSTTTNPTVQVLDIYKGVVGDKNPIVVFKFLDSVLYGAN